MNVSDQENRKKYDSYLKTRKLIRQEVDRQIKEMDINEILAELERLMIKETTDEWMCEHLLEYGTDEQKVRLKIDYGWELL